MLAVVGTNYPWTNPLALALAKVGAPVKGSAGPAFSAQMLLSVKAFQKARGLTQDGDPGPNVWRELRTAGAVEPIDATRAKLALAGVLHAAQWAKIAGLVELQASGPPNAETLDALALLKQAEESIIAAVPDVADIVRKTYSGGIKYAVALPIRGQTGVTIAQVSVDKAFTPAIGAIPLVVALPFLAEATAAAVADAVVATAGTAAALGLATWIATQVGAKLGKAAEKAPTKTDIAAGEMVAQPNPGQPPQRSKWDFKDFNLKAALRQAAAFLALAAGWLVSGALMVASLLPAAVVAAGNAALWILGLLALAVFGKKKRKVRYG